MTRTASFAKALWKLHRDGMPLDQICSFCELTEGEAVICLEFGARLLAIEETNRRIRKMCGRSCFDIMELAGLDCYPISYTGN